MLKQNRRKPLVGINSVGKSYFNSYLTKNVIRPKLYYYDLDLYLYLYENFLSGKYYG
jgi:predicted AAA+ superfamily ATPase